MTQQTSSANERRDTCGGYTLLETAVALAIMAMVAAIAYPRASMDLGTSALRPTSLRIASVLRQDRNAAIRQRQSTHTQVDTVKRAVYPGSNGRDVHLAPGIAVFLAGAGGSHQNTIHFLPTGETTGGRIVLTSGTSSYRIEVAPLSGAVTVSAEDGRK